MEDSTQSGLVTALMRKPLLILALAGEAIFGGALQAQDAPAVSPWKVEALSREGQIQYDVNSGRMTATNGVRVTYKAGTPDEAELTANAATINQKAGTAAANGKVTLRRDGTIWKSEQLTYNFRTKTIESARFRSGSLAVFLKGEAMTGNQTNGVYRAHTTILTTDDTNNPDFFIKAKEVEVVPGEHAIFRGAVVHVGRMPVFYLPYYRRSFKRHPWNIHLEPGFKSEWGAFLLSAVRWPSNEYLGGEFNMDYRTDRGFGLGPTLEYKTPEWGGGNLNIYHASDDDPLTDSRGLAISRERNIAQWNHRYTKDQFSAISVLEYESDEYVRRDFFEDRYRQNVQPNSFLEVANHWDNYNLSVLMQPRINAFYEGIQRTPDIQFTGTRNQLGDTPFFYDTESSVGYFQRRYDYASSSEDYDLLRADTLHKIYMPKTIGGWLNVTPRVGARFTHYGESNGLGSTKPSSERYVVHTGMEVSTKLSKMMPELNSRLLGIDTGARHIIQPSINFAYIPRPNRVPDELDKFDYEITSPRLLPLEMPEYNAIDNIDSQNVVRLSLRNRLQTKRNEAVVDVVDWDVYTDWRMNPNNNQATFADLFSDAQIQPRDWISLYSNLRYDVDNSLWRAFNQGINLHPQNHRWSLTAGQYYYLAHPSISTADRTDVYYSGAGLRLNENWSFSTRQYFDAKAGELTQHDYILHRDMRSWTFFLDLSFRKDTGRRDNEMALSFNYSLKAFPRKPGFN